MAILAGQRIRALDFAGYASVHDFANDTVEVSSGQAGTWLAPPTQVGVHFMAPASGAVKCNFAGRIRSTQGGSLRCALACELRTGSVIGSGVVVDEASSDMAIEIGVSPTTNTSQAEMGSFRIHSGLTPGDLYHFRFMVLAAGAGSVSIYARSIAVEPWHE